MTNGGLMKSTSLVALAATSGLLLSMGSALAADLGGNCCADLEERVAELEATTVKKGNRKVSLTISGQVNRTTMFWNDGGRSNAYFGLDNTNSSSRFAISGNAKISAEYSAGYNLLIEVSDKARTVNASQKSEDGVTKFANAGASGDHALGLRDAQVWIQSERLGRLALGRITNTTSPGVIDLGGIGVVSPGTVLIGNGILLRDANTGRLTGLNLGDVTDNAADFGFRMEGLKYTTPTFQGFVASASIGESLKLDNPSQTPAGSEGYNGQVYGVDLKYANEFNGLRVAAGIGYEHSELDTTPSTSGGSSFGKRVSQYGISGSLFHVPTGLFVQGVYTNSARAQPFTGVDGSAVTGSDVTATQFIIQSGITKNFFGVGDTSLFGEYGKHNGWAQANVQTGVNAVTAGGDNTFWGLGTVQKFDAAALELYAGWRHYSTSDATVGGVATSFKDIDIVATGARIKF
jgi:hypothetical protein